MILKRPQLNRSMHTQSDIEVSDYDYNMTSCLISLVMS